MLHLMKYRLRLCLRDRSSMFWGLCFPLLLSTLFYFTIMQGGKDTSVLEPVKVAFVSCEVDSDGQPDSGFSDFIHGLDGDTLQVMDMSGKKADHALRTGKVTGIFTDGDPCSLKIAGNDIEENVLKSLLKVRRLTIIRWRMAVHIRIRIRLLLADTVWTAICSISLPLLR